MIIIEKTKVVNGIEYTLVGDYYLPNLILPPTGKNCSFGKYGRMRLNYLKEHKRALYTDLLVSGRLYDHLHEVDERAKAQVEQIMNAIASADGTDEALKAQDQMRWVALMNNYCNCAEETVIKEVIFE